MKEFKLDNEPKINSGFNAPDNYFDTFSEKLITKLPASETKVISIFETRKKWYIAVAAILILLLSIPLYFKYQSSSNEINSEALEDYLTFHSNITEEELVNSLETEDLEKIKIDLQLEEEDLEEILINNFEFEQYLIN
jgi:hypothetical protein